MPLCALEREGQKKWFLEYCDKLDMLFAEFMTEIGGVHDERFHEWHIETKCGELGFTCYGDWIPGRFTDPEIAKPFTGCSPYSGKWNHHTFWGQCQKGEAITPEQFMEHFKRDVRRILP